MLIAALVLAVIGLAALVTAVVTSNELFAWVCIGASALGVLLLVFDAIRERTSRHAVVPAGGLAGAATEVIEPVETTEVIEPVIARGPADEDDSSEITSAAEEYDESVGIEDYPDEVVYDEPDYDTVSDDEPEYPEPAEVAAVHTVSEDYLVADEEYDDDTDDDRYDEAPGDDSDGEDAFADDIEEPEVEAVETVTYTYVESDETATTYTYVESDETATTYTYVESDETDSTPTHDEPRNARERSDTSDGD
ncbi:hypothetical protein [Mycolicibacterium sp.]|uniref:hypothetical protein n=1 Tax=Mycolicibacterium sp. TaxID=2320850 RepID=UPI0028AC0006|nr:hypothetical protein [Mycolicibacterium sp.]